MVPLNSQTTPFPKFGNWPRIPCAVLVAGFQGRVIPYSGTGDDASLRSSGHKPLSARARAHSRAFSSPNHGQALRLSRYKGGGGNPYPEGKPVKAVVRKIAGKWYVTVCYELEAEERPDTGVSAGVDMNVRQVAVVDTTGEAEIIPAPDTGRLDAKIGRNQRRLARQRKGSRRRTRTRLRLQRLQRKRANRRRNWRHQVSRRIANRAGTVIVEKLNTAGMTKSAKGTLENPGRKVKAKSGLNREILNTGWHSVKEMLAYKCLELIEVNPAYTSQSCNACGYVDPENRNDRKFECVACGHADHADLNAARNILTSGTGVSARRGALALATPVIRETDRKLAA